MSSPAKQRARIAKLRALAERPGTPAEGETARRLADELAAKLPPAAPRPRTSGIPTFATFVQAFDRYGFTGELIYVSYDEHGRRVVRTVRRDK